MSTASILIERVRLIDQSEPVDVVVTPSGLAVGASVAGGADVIDGAGLTLAPGFIDIQINGGFGDDFTIDPDSMWRVGAKLLEHGVTAFLPTIISSPPETVDAALRSLQGGPPPGYIGAEPLGLHIEGPMISPSKRGTHPRRYLRAIDDELIAGLTGNAGVALVTLAPELPGGLGAISNLVANGVVVSMGHSAATAAQARAGLAAGASHGTHLFNAMPPLHHREPGLAGALMTDPQATAGVIVDGIHVAPEMVTVAFNAMGRDRLILMTDAMAGMGMPPGDYEIGGVAVTVDETGVRNSEGALAGSTLTMDEAVRNVARFAGISNDDALAMASIAPRRLLSMSPELSAANGFVLVDATLSVVTTIVAGKIVFDARERGNR